MKKNLGVVQAVYPMPVLMVAAYDNEYGINLAVYTICEKYGIERSSAYNKKNRALNHLTVLLFGKG